MKEERSPSSQVALGVVLIGLGLVLLVNNLFDVTGVGRLWPLVFIAIGAVKLARPSQKDQREGAGLLLVMFGSWALLNTLHIVRWRDSWPLLFVAIGINMIWRAYAGAGEPRVEEPNGR